MGKGALGNDMGSIWKLVQGLVAMERSVLKNGLSLRGKDMYGREKLGPGCQR